MAIDRFFIAPYDKESGLRQDLKPWLIPDQAFSSLNNAYVFRGRVRKRFGGRWMGPTQLSSRFRVNIGTTTAVTGNLGATVVPGAVGAIGQMFSVGTTVFTVFQANGATYTTGAATATFNTATGTLVITGNNTNPLTIVYWYPALPVMGLATFEVDAINNDPVVGFDTRFAYQFTGAGWERLNLETVAGDASWTGSDSQFFWTASYFGANAFDYVLFVTNYNENEPRFMRVLSGPASVPALTWSSFRPVISNLIIGPPLILGITLDSARILIQFKNRLLAFNTWENETADGATFNLRNYPFRMRFSAVGSALAADAWRQDIPGRGSGLDCPTNEAIITVEFVKDRLIVFLERSTWEIVYTGNQIYPFAWQQINTELGVESTFSIVPFDKVCLGIGNVGIMACNGSNVERIDNSIPDFVFQIHNDNGGVERVAGIRDYFVEMVYWTLATTNANSSFPFPRFVLVYNYKAQTWALNRDNITAFGYFQSQSDTTWDSTTVTWDDNEPWDLGQLQAIGRQIIAGNQQGYVFIVDADVPINAAVSQITNITVAPGGIVTITSINHNLIIDDFIFIRDVTGTGDFPNLNFTIQKVIRVIDNNNFQFVDRDIVAGTYTGNGTYALVSKIEIQTKEFNFYTSLGRNAYISKVDFQVDATTTGEITADYFVSTNNIQLVQESLPIAGTGSILGTNILETFPYPSIPFEADSERLVHPIYFQADGEFIQLYLYMTDDQMKKVVEVDTDVFTGPALEDFQMHSMCFFAQPTSSRMQ